MLNLYGVVIKIHYICAENEQVGQLGNRKSCQMSFEALFNVQVKCHIMNRIVLSAALLTATVFAQAQNYTLDGVEHETVTVPVTVSNFNGQTLSVAPKGKNKAITLIRTKFSTPLDDYNALARPELKIGNIIGHPTLGWDDTDYRIPDIVPEVYDGEWILNDVFYDGDYPVATYGRAPETKPLPWGQSEKDISRRGRDPHLMMLVDPSKEVKKVYNTSSMTFPPKNRASELDRQSVNWAVVKDGILYFSISGLMGFDNGQNAYVVAVDTSTDKTLWVSKPNTCNSDNFLVIDNSIVCGFGDSGKPDFINVLNRFTGVQKQQLWVASAPCWLAIGSDGRLYVSLYDKHVAFKIAR